MLYGTFACRDILERRLAVFERLGGKRAREAWRRFHENPNAEAYVEYAVSACPSLIETCAGKNLPLACRS
jgi:hypothetical protein